MPGDPTAITPPRGFVRIGLLGRPYQLQGGLHLTWLEEPVLRALDHVERVFVVGHGLVALQRARTHGPGTVLYLAGVRDREAAGRLTGAEVYVASSDLPPDAADSPRSPVGLELVTGGRVVGRVAAVRRIASNPLLVVATAAGEILVPLAAPYVAVREDRVELIDPPADLLEAP